MAVATSLADLTTSTRIAVSTGIDCPAFRPSLEGGRLAALRERVAALGLRCAFSEPQMNAGLLRTVAEGSGLQLVEIDALGVALEPGPDLYPELLRRMADAVAGCLAR